MNSESPKVVSDVIRSSKKILLVIQARPSIDGVCALAAMYALLTTHYKKEVDIATNAEFSPRASAILRKAGIEKDKILQDLPQKQYVISIKKQGEKIESINYNETDSTFNFVITPFNGALDLESVDVSESGSNYDLIITIDTASLNFLDELYKKNTGIFQNTTTISIDNHKSNSGYATHTVIYDDVDTTSQVVTRFMEDLGMKFDELYATILLAGIYSFTNLGTRNKVRPETFADMSRLIALKAKLPEATDILYAPNTVNEIFLIGDILDSANEGTSSVFADAKVVGCKISLNKEELETVDMDKVAQVVFWNVKIPGYKVGYIIFQRSQTTSVGYLNAYDSDINLTEILKTVNGKGDKTSGKIIFESDMNATEEKIKDALGIAFVQKENKFTPPSFTGQPFDDFGPELDFPMPTAPVFTPPAVMPPISAPTPAPTDGEEKKDNPAIPTATVKFFDPRAGK
jgi:nanoRNase/pAp phosphatase (c-di-AMP/oligoRNAs hydrolase)